MQVYMGPLEKREHCPHCRRELSQGEYDMQRCVACNTGMDFRPPDEQEKANPVWIVVTGSTDVRGYRLEGADLLIQFARGVVYRYHDVPPDIVRGFEKTNSKGRYIGKYLKLRAYRPTRMDEQGA